VANIQVSELRSTLEDLRSEMVLRVSVIVLVVYSYVFKQDMYVGVNLFKASLQLESTDSGI